MTANELISELRRHADWLRAIRAEVGARIIDDAVKTLVSYETGVAEPRFPNGQLVRSGRCQSAHGDVNMMQCSLHYGHTGPHVTVWS